MSSSIILMGLVLLSNSLFFVNYVFISIVRMISSKKVQQNELNDQHHQPNDGRNLVEEDDASNDRSGEEETNDIAQGTETDNNNGANALKSKMFVLQDALYGFFLGTTKKETLTEHQFIGWDPIPYKAGLVATTIIVILVTILFSDAVLSQLLPEGSSYVGAGSTESFCPVEDAETKADNFRDVLADATNLDLAKFQHSHTNNFLKSLKEDVTLYGTSVHQCQNEPRTKEEFRNSASFGKEMGTTFFPGYCAASQERAMKQAREQTCEKRVCGDVEQIIGAEGKLKNNWNTGAKALFSEVGIGKKPGKNDIKIEYDYGYVEECFTTTVPCPDFTLEDEISGILQDYRYEQLKFAASIDNVTLPIDGLDEEYIENATQQIVEFVLRQLEVAAFVYVAYTCVGMYFPAPLIIFRPTIPVMVRQFLFGAQKYTFMLGFLSVWWGASYFRTFGVLVNIELYLGAFLADPCVASTPYVEEIGRHYREVCHELVTMDDEFTNNAMTIDHTLTMVDMMRDPCDCDFPFKSLFDVMPNEFNSLDPDMLSSIGFGRVATHICDSNSISNTNCLVLGAAETTPTHNSSVPPFVGNNEACESTAFVRAHILKVATDSELSFWEIWISSGIIAALLIKACASNFGIALMRLADPMSVCDGKFEGPPKHYDFLGSDRESMVALRTTKENNLRMNALGSVVIWGLFMNLLMLNLFIVSLREKQEQDGTDSGAGFGVFLICLSITVVFVAMYSSRRVDRMLRDVTSSSRDVAADDVDEANSTTGCEV